MAANRPRTVSALAALALVKNIQIFTLIFYVFSLYETHTLSTKKYNLPLETVSKTT